jgi:uncharacterized membrane protein
MISMNTLLTSFNLTPAKMAKLYLVFAVLSVAGMASIVPPFAAPDEFAHAFRAEAVSSGQFLAVPMENGSLGGILDSGLLAVFQMLEPTATAPASPSASLARAARHVVWARSSVLVGFPNTAQYGPALYTPQAAGFVIGRALGLRVIQSYRLARLLAGLSAVAIVALAIAQAQRGHIIIAVMASTPMFLFLATSLSQDGLLLAVSALFAALASRPAASRALNWIALVCALLMAMARPPYALLSFLLIRGREGRPVSGWFRAEDGPLAPFAICAVTLLWLSADGALSQPSFAPDPSVNPAAQLAGLLHSPLSIISIAAGTLTDDIYLRIWHEVVGVLGWLSIVLPEGAYAGALVALCFAATTCLLQWPARSLLHSFISLAVFAVSIGTVYAATYLTWTPVGFPSVKGVQGRYLLPYFFGLPLILPSLLPTQRAMGGKLGQKLDIAISFVGLAAWVLMVAVAIGAFVVLEGVYGPPRWRW